MAESKTPKKTTKRTYKKKKVEEPVVEKKQYEVSIIEEETEEVISESVEEPAAAPVKKTSKKTVSVKLGTVIPEEGLKIRRGPGVKCEKIGKLAKDETVEILEENGDFVRIGHDQWVMKSFLGGL